jgi:hypothetical protein
VGLGVKALVVMALSAIVVVCSPPTARAGFALTTSATPSFSVALNGTDRTPTYTAPLTVDNSAVGISLTGWNLTITSTQYSTGTGKKLATTASAITAVGVVCASTCTVNPTNSVTYPLALPAGSGPPTPVKFFNAAAATGLGTFTITPTVAVSVPANAYAGAYTSTLTVDLVSGP